MYLRHRWHQERGRAQYTPGMRGQDDDDDDDDPFPPLAVLPPLPFVSPDLLPTTIISSSIVGSGTCADTHSEPVDQPPSKSSSSSSSDSMAVRLLLLLPDLPSSRLPLVFVLAGLLLPSEPLSTTRMSLSWCRRCWWRCCRRSSSMEDVMLSANPLRLFGALQSLLDLETHFQPSLLPLTLLLLLLLRLLLPLLLLPLPLLPLLE
mmetsp:Transcript_25171/g.45550  ORF Transcript_25171/g.45550 Transcript_25171/m.45550 type:complete len:205 (-) Transcript_25171:391-1005(-)